MAAASRPQTGQEAVSSMNGGGQGIDLDLEAAAFLRHLLNLCLTQGLWKTLRMGLLGR